MRIQSTGTTLPTPERPLFSPSLTHICWPAFHHLAVDRSMKWPDTMQRNDFGYIHFFFFYLNGTPFTHSILYTKASFSVKKMACVLFYSPRLCVKFDTASISIKLHLMQDQSAGDKGQGNGRYAQLLIKFMLACQLFTCLNMPNSKVISTYQPGYCYQFALLWSLFSQGRISEPLYYFSPPPHLPFFFHLSLYSIFTNINHRIWNHFQLKSMNATINPWWLNLRSIWINQ